MNREPWILGISASHNGSACLLKGDQIVVAIQEERLSRIKRQRIYGAKASRAVAYCLNYAGIEPSDLSVVVLCIQGRKQDQLHNLSLEPFLNVLAYKIPTLVIPHHYGHAVSVFATSGFAESAVLIIDGAGSPVSDFTPEELSVMNGNRAADSWETISLYHVSGTTIVPLEKHVIERGAWLLMHDGHMPSFGSLGGMFSAAAQQIFGEASEAGKVMGLAPYGKAEFPSSDFFDVVNGRFHFKDTVSRRFQYNERWPNRTSEYEALAASVQSALEDAVLYLVQHIRELCSSDNLCYAGGVALNSVANERIIRESGFKNVYIMPAAEDSGTSIGAAYYGLWLLTQQNSQRLIVHDAPGRTYSSADVSAALDAREDVQVVYSSDVLADAVQLLCDGKIIGWFDGGSELGPRALGQRSILCDPRQPDAKETLNRRVKMREAFRPFAPAVLLEEATKWFEFGDTTPKSQFMLRVVPVNRERKDEVPAIVHVDGTGRVQTLTQANNGRFYELVKQFHEKTGVPILLNTSFNRMGQPIIETPADAIECLLSTGLDCCVFEDRIVFKKKRETAMPDSDGPAHFKLFLLPNFLDADSCASLRAELAQSPTTQAPVYIEGTEGTIHETVRKTTSLHPAGETFQQIYERLFSQKAALEEHFGTALIDCERPQFLRYEKGDFFVRHQDGNTHQIDFDHLRVRRISIVVFLNDSSVEPRENCFSGGALTFYDPTKTFALIGETGLLVAFTSDTFHEVVPVTSGERFTIISWFR